MGLVAWDGGSRFVDGGGQRPRRSLSSPRGWETRIGGPGSIVWAWVDFLSLGGSRDCGGRRQGSLYGASMEPEKPGVGEENDRKETP